jgi:hypothetical protein
MFCCGGGGGNKDPIVDIDALVKKWVQKNNGRPNFCERLTGKYELKVQWSAVEQSSSLHEFKLTRKQDSNDKIQSRKMCLFKTEFTNTTGSAQSYTFRTERQTKSTVRTSVQVGFSLGGSLNVPLGVPSVPAPGVEPLGMTGGLTSTLSIQHTDEQTFEEALTWSVDSAVEVKAGHRTTASLIIEEEKASARFVVRHVLRPKEMTIPVYLVDRGAGGRYIRSFDWPSEHLYSLVSEHAKMRVNRLGSGPGIEVFTEGSCDVCYGAKQIIKIREEPYLASQESRDEDNLLPSLPAPTPAPAPISVTSSTTSQSPRKQEQETSLSTTKLGTTPSDENLKKPLLQMKKMAVHT